MKLFLWTFNHLFKGVGCINVTDLVVPGIFLHEEMIQKLNLEIIMTFVLFLINMIIIIT